MNCTVVASDKEHVHYSITGCTRPELENKVDFFMAGEGYKPKERVSNVFVYTKGNRAMRLIFGAFAKYHRNSVSIQGEQEPFTVTILKESSGMSGGLIGMQQVKKEYQRLNDAFQSYMV